MRGTLPTTEIKLPTKVADILDEWLSDEEVVKRTKTAVTANVDHATAVAMREKLRDSLSDDMPVADSKRIQTAIDELKPVITSLAAHTADIRSFDLEQHPLGSLVPEMSKAEKGELRKSMKAHGFLPAHPIVIHEGKVLDGWHRYQEASKQGIDIVTKDYRGDDPAGYVLATNIQRRHLTDDQKAMVAGELAAFDPGTTTAQAADRVKVKAWNAGCARRVVNASSRLADAVRDGSVSLGHAAEVVYRDPDMIAHLNGDDIDRSVADLVAESLLRTAKPKRTVVKIELDGDEPWVHAEVVFDANGEALGEAYWRPLPIPLDQIDTDPILERIAEACEWSTERKVVRAGIRDTLSAREVDALYRDFEGSDPPADMSAAKRQVAVASGLVEWFASAEEDDDE